MALKKIITKEQFAKLSKDLQAEYIEDGDGYRLDTEGDEDTGALKRAKDREVQLRKDAEKRANELETKLADLDTNDARKKGDIEMLEKQWKDKHDKEIAKIKSEHETQISELTGSRDKLQSSFKKQLVDNVAMQLASKLNNKSPKVLIPHIKERLMADFEGDEPVTKILKDGKPSAMSLDDLHKEFVANKDFAGIIIGTQSSGGAGDSSSSAGKQQQSQQQHSEDLSSLDPKALVEKMKMIREAESQEN